MKGSCFFLLLLFISILYLDAFLPNPNHVRTLHVQQLDSKTKTWKTPPQSLSSRLNHNSILFETANNNNINKQQQDEVLIPFTHQDILWKVRPPPETPMWKRIWLRFAANVIRLDCKIKGQTPPIVLCPKGGKAVLEAHVRVQPNDDSSSFKRPKFKKIARFGFTTERGPAAPPIIESVEDIYGIQGMVLVGVAAIIYMYVEPEYRKKQVGTLALDVIALIHAIQGCDFTVLVVDDDGSGKLNNWYEKNGYSRAPKLQDMMGSPNGIHGITMMAPTRSELPHGCHIQWW